MFSFEYPVLCEKVTLASVPTNHSLPSSSSAPNGDKVVES